MLRTYSSLTNQPRDLPRKKMTASPSIRAPAVPATAPPSIAVVTPLEFDAWRPFSRKGVRYIQVLDCENDEGLTGAVRSTCRTIIAPRTWPGIETGSIFRQAVVAMIDYGEIARVGRRLTVVDGDGIVAAAWWSIWESRRSTASEKRIVTAAPFVRTIVGCFL